MTQPLANGGVNSFRWFGAAAFAGALWSCSPEAPLRTATPASPAESAQTTIENTEPAVYRGAALARQVCAQCHDISTGSAPERSAGAPSFASVAKRPGTTPDKLRQWLSSSHPSMPNYVFDSSSIDDLTAYIISLANQP
jgi:mono/diheme cytochrome c family protein